METAAYGASSVRLLHLAAKGDARAAGAMKLINAIPRLVTATLIGQNMAVYAGTFLLTRQLEESGLHDAEAWATLALTPAFFIFAETLPKRIAHAVPNRYTLTGSRIMLVSCRLFAPIGLALGAAGAVARLLLKKFGLHSQMATGRLRLLESLEAGAADGILTEEQRQIAFRIMEAEKLRVGDVTIPLTQAFTLPEDCSCREAAEKMLAASWRRASLVDKAGNLTGRKVTLNYIMKHPASLDQPVSQLSSDMASLNQNMLLGRALRKMREERRRVAIVTGKSGLPVGIVTVSDMLSRIVGTMRL